MKFLDAFDGLLEQLPSEFVFLEVGEHINLLQVEEVGSFLLDGHVAGRFALLVGEVVNVVLLLHLVLQALGGIHPLHHVINLFRGQNLLVSDRKGLLGQCPDNLNVFDCRFSDIKHRRFVIK